MANESTQSPKSSGPGRPAASGQKPASAAKPSKPSRPAKPLAKTGNSFSAWAVIACVLALLALGLSGYLGYRQQLQVLPQLDSAAGESESIRGLSASLSQQTEELVARVQEQKQQIDALEAENADLDGQLKDILAAMSEAYQEDDRGVETWQLQSVAQLLAISNQRLRHAGDFSGAIEIRQLADEQLANLGDPRLVVVRHALNEEIANLRQMEPDDVNQISMRILALARSVDALPLNAPRVVQEPQVVAETAMEADGESPGITEWSYWTGVWNQLRSDLASLVKVRQIESSVTPLFAREQQYYAVENLRLLLHAAHLAALQRDAQLYVSALDSAQAWLAKYFSDSAKETQTMRETIDGLSSRPVQIHAPAVSESLELLRGVLAE